MSGGLLLSFECIFGQNLNFKLFSKLLDVILSCFVVVVGVVEVVFFLSSLFAFTGSLCVWRTLTCWC